MATLDDQKNILDGFLAGRPRPERTPQARWKHESLFEAGFVPVPQRFLQLYSLLKPHPLTTSEAVFVLQVMTYKWTADAPFPSYAKLATRMGVTDKAVRRIAQAIERKGLMRRIPRQGGTNKFDLNPLFDALLNAQDIYKANGSHRPV